MPPRRASGAAPPPAAMQSAPPASAAGGGSCGRGSSRLDPPREARIRAPRAARTAARSSSGSSSVSATRSGGATCARRASARGQLGDATSARSAAASAASVPLVARHVATPAALDAASCAVAAAVAADHRVAAAAGRRLPQVDDRRQRVGGDERAERQRRSRARATQRHSRHRRVSAPCAASGPPRAGATRAPAAGARRRREVELNRGCWRPRHADVGQRLDAGRQEGSTKVRAIQATKYRTTTAVTLSDARDAIVQLAPPTPAMKLTLLFARRRRSRPRLDDHAALAQRHRL